MDTQLLEAAARSAGVIVLLDSPRIDAFLELQRLELLTGVLHTLPSGARYATVHGPTPDGLAFLALLRCVRKHSRLLASEG